MRKRRILPATCPRTTWSLSSFTRNIALGRASMTSPSNSTFSSFATGQAYRCRGGGACGLAWADAAALGGALLCSLVFISFAAPSTPSTVENPRITTTDSGAVVLGAPTTTANNQVSTTTVDSGSKGFSLGGGQLFSLAWRLALVIVIIAAVFTDDLRWISLGVAAAAALAYGACQRLRLTHPLLLVPLALATWWFTHESGVHATIAGVVLGLLTRVRPDEDESTSPAEHLEHLLSPVSAAVAVPFFALVSAGVPLGGGTSLAGDPVVIGVVLGLVLGKPLGVLGGTWAVTRLTRAELGEGLAWRDLGGLAMVAGVGFTVSLLVSDLSFAGAEREAAKTAVLVGSLTAGLAGAALLHRRNRHHREASGEVV